MACLPCQAAGKGATEEMMRMDEAYARADGTYALASYRDCEGGHHGQWEGLSIFVVHRLDPGKERLFKRDELAQAADYVKSLNPRPPIEKLPTAALCDAAVRDLYEGRLVYA